MPKKRFEGTCKNCKLTVIDKETKKVFPDDHPYMIAAKELWERQSLEVKLAWHKVSCMKSRKLVDVKMYDDLLDTFAEVIDKIIKQEDKLN